MATSKTVRLQHSGGGTVTVSADKAERLLAGAGWSKTESDTKVSTKKRAAAAKPAADE